MFTFTDDLLPVVLLLMAFPLAAFLFSPIVKEVRWWFVQREMRRQIEKNNKVFEAQRAERMREALR
jgi:hypothetical protein